MNLTLFGKNAITYGIGNMCLRASAFLLVPLYTHYLSITEYGLLATLFLTIQIMITFISLGSRTALLRFSAECESKNQMGYLLGSSIAINLAGGLILLSISILFLKPLFKSILHTDLVLEYILLTSAAAMSQCLCMHILTYYRAKNEAFKFVVFSILALLLLIFCNLILILILNQGIKGALIAQIITYGCTFLFVLVNVFKTNTIVISIKMISKLLRFGIPLVFVMSGDLITDTSAMYFLSYFGSLEDVAVYSLGFKIAQIATIVFILPFQLAYEPFVYSNIDENGIRSTISKLLTYFMIGFSFVALGITFISRELLSLIAPPEYLSAYLIIFLILPGIAFRGIYYVAQSLINIKGKTHVTGVIVLFFTLLSVVLGYLFIPLYGMYGVALVFNFTLMSIAIILMIFGLKEFPIPIEIKRLGISCLLLAFFLTLVFFLHEACSPIYYSIIPIAVSISICIIYFGGFFDNKERLFIRNMLHKTLRTGV